MFSLTYGAPAWSASAEACERAHTEPWRARGTLQPARIVYRSIMVVTHFKSESDFVSAVSAQPALTALHGELRQSLLDGLTLAQRELNASASGPRNALELPLRSLVHPK